MICSKCKLDISTVGEVRGCSLCQRDGTSAAVHAKYSNEDKVEKLVAEANPGAFPFQPAGQDDDSKTQPA